MKRTCLILTVATVMLTGSSALAHAQDRAGKELPANNPFAGNSEAIRAGMGLFRSFCADCHGVDATGVRAPDLTQIWGSGRTDVGLFQTLRRGVPNTEMPAIPARIPDAEVWKLLAYLRTLAAPVQTDIPQGDAENGARLFRANCMGCHRVNGSGGRFGPDLSRVGSARTRDVLVRRIRGAIEDFAPGFEPVTLVPPSGQPIHGVKKNEDLFSIQIMDTRERIQGFIKSDMREVKNETKSAMPPFGPDRLSDRDLDDLVQYLQTLRGLDRQ